MLYNPQKEVTHVKPFLLKINQKKHFFKRLQNVLVQDMEGNPRIATHRDGRFYGVIIITSNLNPLKMAYRGVNRTASQYSLILVYGGI